MSVSALGNDRVVIGAMLDNTSAPAAGVAYLFSTNGTLLTVFTNPTPASDDRFGCAVVAMGSDRVIIGAFLDDAGTTDAGAAYLFSTNGALFTTFTNPAPIDSSGFGYGISASGGSQIVIGSMSNDTGAVDAGAAYLFSTNGALLTTFTNPTPAMGDAFGWPIAASSDRVLIGTPLDDTGATDAGAAYLFNTAGELLTTFTNPAPEIQGWFGVSTAMVGNDRVLIGAPGNYLGVFPNGVIVGAAYLFSTNGTLLTTFTNPFSWGYNDGFSFSVAPVGTDRVLIGTLDGETAYLFNIAGALLNKIPNPTPSAHEFDGFGYPVATLNNNCVLIGAYYADNSVSDEGMVYLFNVAPPLLTITPTVTNTLAVSWPWPSWNFVLQQSTDAIGMAGWSNVTDTIQNDGANRILIVDSLPDTRFYRLVKPLSH